jgi:general secretion pathway protein L
VLLAQVELPAMKRQRLARAAPYALEEQLAEEVDEVHVAVGDRDARGRVANAIVSRERLDSWLQQLKDAGLHPDVVSPEVLGVPWQVEAEEGSWSLLVNGTQALLRTETQMGLAFDSDNLIAVLRATVDSAGDTPPKQLTVVSCGDSAFADSAAHTELAEFCAGENIALNLRREDEACGVLLARGFNEQTGINLLQGDYSRKQQLEKLLRPWRPALILAALWLVLQAGMLGVEYQRLAAEDRELREQIEAVYREAFPQARKVVNPKVQMERGLQQLRGGGGASDGLLALLAQSGDILKDINGAQLRGMRFKQGSLDVDINLPDLQALDKLKQRLADEARLQVEIVSASSRNGKVESRLSLKGGGA